MKIKKHIPNAISILRIVAALIILAFFIIIGFRVSANPLIKINFLMHNLSSRLWFSITILTIIFGFSDFLDGYLARKWKVTSKLGAAIDPVGDTIFFWNIIVFLIIFNIISIIPILIYGFREFVLLIMRIFARIKNSGIPVNIYGKVKTVILFPLLFFMMIIFQLNINNTNGFYFNVQNQLFYLIFNWSFAFPIILAYISLWISIKQFKNLFFNKQPKNKKQQPQAK